MKTIVTADLHLNSKCLAEQFYLKKQKRIIDSIIPKDAELILIAGDVIESSILKYDINPLEALYSLFERPVIFCLGNHEFAFQYHSDVIKYWSKFKHPHVHCLDIEGNVNFGGKNFVGNVLWYDFTLNKCRLVMQGEILDGWLDATIKNFDPMKECQKCKDQILKNLSKEQNNILITHMVPHIELNAFSQEDPHSPWNAYSGCDRFLLDCQDSGCANIEYAICGHTHRRECKEIWNVNCINVGNDYYHRTGTINYFTVDL